MSAEATRYGWRLVVRRRFRDEQAFTVASPTLSRPYRKVWSSLDPFFSALIRPITGFFAFEVGTKLRALLIRSLPLTEAVAIEISLATFNHQHH
jgi:predicted PurR-regulated permease PerM